MGYTYLAHFNYHSRPKYLIYFQLVLNDAYSCPSGFKFWLYALVIKTTSYSIPGTRNCKIKD